jgi:glutamate-1-semialdehyde aminotransferase
MHWTGDEIVAASDSARAAAEAGALTMLLHLGLLNRGIWLPSRGEFAVSTPMGESEIDQVVGAVEAVLGQLKPYIEDETPHLLLAQ